MTVSLIISTYNQPNVLHLCLQSILAQSRMPDEVIIGDDGSDDRTRRLVDDFAVGCPVPVIHLWHPDEGFRLATMRNKCIARASGDYIVQIDGDVVLSRHFIADHTAAARPGHYAKGSRLRLNPVATSKVLTTGYIDHFFSPLSSSLLKDREKAVRLPRCLAVPLSHRYHTRGTGLGANLGFWRSDLLAINGYDEAFVGWGGEDNDLELRLQANGIKTFKLFRCGLVRHLWHRESANPDLEKSLQYIKHKLADGQLRAVRGIDKYLDHAI